MKNATSNGASLLTHSRTVGLSAAPDRARRYRAAAGAIHNRSTPIILAAEDDPGDRVLLQHAFEAAIGQVDLRLAVDGSEFLDYLKQRPPWEECERPDLILLDLNMPRLNGLAALREIKTHPELRSIPVVVLSTSRSPEDVADVYASGANAYVPKPASFHELEETIHRLCEYWFRLCLVPRLSDRAGESPEPIKGQGPDIPEPDTCNKYVKLG